jgi:hypothetical protein
LSNKPKHSKDFLVIPLDCGSTLLKLLGTSLVKGSKQMDVKLILVGLTVVFTISCLFFGTKNGFYDSDNYHGNGSAH